MIKYCVAMGFLFSAVVSVPASASNFACDRLMMGLMRQNGGCPTGTCKYNIVNGKLLGFDGATVTNSDDFTEMKSVSTPTKDSNGVSSVRIENGKNGEFRMTMVVVDDRKRETKTEFGLNGADGKCLHEQTERKRPENLSMAVDYDREFCEAAAQAYEGVDAEQSKTCDDLMQKLVGKFEERTNALAKSGKAFREASASEAFNAIALRNNGANKAGQAKLMQALKQRDRCMKAAVEVAQARPLSFKERYGEELYNSMNRFNKNPDKRAFPQNGLPSGPTDTIRR